jgi:hypothetical protein
VSMPGIRSMRTVDGLFTTRQSILARLSRDCVVGLRVAAMALTYLVRGGRIRRAYRQAIRRGSVVWLDGEPKDGSTGYRA